MQQYRPYGYPTGYDYGQAQRQRGVISTTPQSGFGGGVSAGLATGASAGANMAAAAVPAQSRKGAIAGQALSSAGSAAALATTIAAAAGAANAVPVAGQIASAGLAVAALFTKIFAGRRQRKKAEAAARERSYRLGQRQQAQETAMYDQRGGLGLGNAQGPVGVTAPVAQPQTPSFSSWGGGVAPAVQPTQESFQ